MDEAGAQLILAAVPTELVESAVQAAEAAGATGATHWKGHGTGRQHTFLFGELFRFPPQREMVGIVVPNDLADDVFEAVTSTVPVTRTGVGFVAMVELSRVVGIRNVAAA